MADFPLLTTDRLLLRQLTHADVDSIIAIFGSEEVNRFSSYPPIETPDKAIELIDWLNRQFSEDQTPNWAIVLREDGRMIGQCGTYGWARSDRHIDIGYHVLPDHWGRGYATEAARAVIGWCFEALDVHRIQADTTEGNIASERVMLKCGFKLEGIWRESCWEHGRFVNIKQYGLLRSEWS